MIQNRGFDQHQIINFLLHFLLFRPLNTDQMLIILPFPEPKRELHHLLPELLTPEHPSILPTFTTRKHMFPAPPPYRVQKRVLLFPQQNIKFINQFDDGQVVVVNIMIIDLIPDRVMKRIRQILHGLTRRRVTEQAEMAAHGIETVQILLFLDAVRFQQLQFLEILETVVPDPVPQQIVLNPRYYHIMASGLVVTHLFIIYEKDVQNY